MQSKEHNAHDAQFSFEVNPMGSLHVNMNDGSHEDLGNERRREHYTTLQSKVIKRTALTERHDNVAPSQNTTNSMSKSMAGKRF